MIVLSIFCSCIKTKEVEQRFFPSLVEDIERANFLWSNLDILLRFASMSSVSFGNRFEYKDVQFLTLSYVLLLENHALSFFNS